MSIIKLSTWQGIDQWHYYSDLSGTILPSFTITQNYSSSHEILESTVITEAHLDMYSLVGAHRTLKEQIKFTRNIYIWRKLLKSKYIKIKHCLPKNHIMVCFTKVIDISITDKMIDKIYTKHEKYYSYKN